MPRYRILILGINCLILQETFVQGTPLLICLVIAAVDALAPCSVVLPNMGLVDCFLGAPKDEESLSYFGSAHFIYLNSILMVIQFINIILFIVTVFFLASHWKKSSQLTKTGDHRGNFLIVIK